MELMDLEEEGHEAMLPADSRQRVAETQRRLLHLIGSRAQVFTARFVPLPTPSPDSIMSSFDNPETNKSYCRQHTALR